MQVTQMEERPQVRHQIVHSFEYRLRPNDADRKQIAKESRRFQHEPPLVVDASPI